MTREFGSVALIHDYWVTLRGGERIFLALRRLFPDADCYALVGRRDLMPGAHDGHERLDLRFSALRFIPRGARHYRALLPLFPWALTTLDLSGYDLVIASSSGFCHGVHARGPLVCYCHTPLRYAWSEYDATLSAIRSPLQRVVLRRTLDRLRTLDYEAAQRVTHYVANSAAVQQRIAVFYDRPSSVVHPFIDTAQFQPDPAGGHGDYYLTVSQLLPYKRVDLAVAACTALRKPLVVVGEGPELAHLRQQAGPTVSFAGRVPEDELTRLYAGCTAFIQCGEEDFGMAALEAQASGRPVIAYGVSGALETVRAGVTGHFFAEQTLDAVAETLRTFNPDEFDPRAIRAHAEQFDEDRFRRGMRREIESVLQRPSSAPMTAQSTAASRAGAMVRRD